MHSVLHIPRAERFHILKRIFRRAAARQKRTDRLPRKIRPVKKTFHRWSRRKPPDRRAEEDHVILRRIDAERLDLRPDAAHFSSPPRMTVIQYEPV